MATYDEYDNRTPAQGVGNLVNYAGAAVSLALIAGVGLWGYELIMRDVTGIPVVRAVQGDMRVAPDNPGGDVVRHEGLSVNAVAAEGGAAGPGDRLVLAPATTQLAQEDLEAQPTAQIAPAGQPSAAAPAAAATASGPLSANDVLALADQIAAGSEPLSALAGGQDVSPQLSVNGERVATDQTRRPVRAAVTISPRPATRPAGLGTAPVVSAPANTEDHAVVAAVASVATVQADTQTNGQETGTVAPVAPAAPVVVDNTPAAAPAVSGVDIALASAVPAGTYLVQLGAFPSAALAAEEWTRLSGLFGEFLGGKDRLIFEASSGGQKFYRLRAGGFDEISDARRLCATLAARNADCIPVVTQ